MYESCFVNADQMLLGMCIVLTLLLVAFACALDRARNQAKLWRENFVAMSHKARIYKRERDQARTELLFPGRKEIDLG